MAIDLLLVGELVVLARLEHGRLDLVLLEAKHVLALCAVALAGFELGQFLPDLLQPLVLGGHLVPQRHQFAEGIEQVHLVFERQQRLVLVLPVDIGKDAAERGKRRQVAQGCR